MLLNEFATTSRTTQNTLYVVDAAVAAGVVDVVLCHTYICATSDEKIWVDPILKERHIALISYLCASSHDQKSLENCPTLR